MTGFVTEFDWVIDKAADSTSLDFRNKCTKCGAFRSPKKAHRGGQIMKKDIHPKTVPCKIIYQGQVVMETLSVKPEIHVDIWSGVHPFWTGEERFVDTEGRVDKFNKRFSNTGYRRPKKG